MKIAILLLSLGLIAGCGTNGSDSNPKALKTKGGQILTAILSSDSTDKDKRYCVVWITVESNDQETRHEQKLLTKNGGIKKGQLNRALREFDIHEQIMWSLLGGAAAMLNLNIPLLVGATLVATGSVIILDSVLGAKKAKDIANDEKVSKISDKVMARSIGRILKEKSDRPGTCDHIKRPK